jgi:uncharacterized protein (DUF1778 family)
MDVMPESMGEDDDLSLLKPVPIVVDEETWQWFNEMLEAPPRRLPGIERALSRPSNFVDSASQ